jgi:preprotein translocase subunit SecY
MAARKAPAWLQVFQVEDVRRKLLITLGLMIVYYLLTFFPLPGVSAYDLRKISAAQAPIWSAGSSTCSQAGPSFDYPCWPWD